MYGACHGNTERPCVPHLSKYVFIMHIFVFANDWKKKIKTSASLHENVTSSCIDKKEKKNFSGYSHLFVHVLLVAALLYQQRSSDQQSLDYLLSHNRTCSPTPASVSLPGPLNPYKWISSSSVWMENELKFVNGSKTPLALPPAIISLLL